MNTQLKKLKSNLKCSASEIARAIGVSRSHYMNIEAGRASLTRKMAQRLNKEFAAGITPEYVTKIDDDLYCGRGMVAKKPVEKYEHRYCLMCDKRFLSKSRFNKMCDICKKIAGEAAL